MSPLTEYTATIDLPYGLHEPVEKTLLTGEQKTFVSTPTGGFIREEYPKQDTVLMPGDVIRLSNGSMVVASSLERGKAEPNPMIDDA